MELFQTYDFELIELACFAIATINSLLLIANSCSPAALNNPVNGVTSCSRVTSTPGYECTVTCNNGYYFYDLSNGDTLSASTSYACSDGGAFPIDRVPDCVREYTAAPATATGAAAAGHTLSFCLHLF